MARSLLVVGARRRLGAAALLMSLGAPVAFATAAPTHMRNPVPERVTGRERVTGHERVTLRGRVTLLERGDARTADLENAVVWLEPLDGTASGAAGAAPLATVPGIAMESRRFRPMVRVVTPGSLVPFPNDDPFRHNVFSNAGPAAFDLGLYGRGEARRATFARAGVYPIFCNIHARMVAYVVAVPTRWHAQAAGDGSFEIADVPAGRWRLHAWHDRGGQRAVEVTVGAGAPAVADVALDARGWRPVAHRNKFGQAYPPEAHDRY